MNTKPALLIRALTINALFSGATALGIALLAPWLATQLGLNSEWPFWVTAAVLAAFALQLLLLIKRGGQPRAEVIYVISADYCWVALSAIAMVMFYPQITSTGLALIGGTALVVLLLATAQTVGVLRESVV